MNFKWYIKVGIILKAKSNLWCFDGFNNMKECQTF